MEARLKLIEQELQEEKEQRREQHDSNRKFFFSIAAGIMIAIVTALFNTFLHYSTIHMLTR